MALLVTLMIVQSLSQKHYAGANFKSLAAYALKLGPHYAKDPLNWELNQSAVAWAKTLNCAGSHLGWSIKEIDYTQRLNTQATTCKSYHYVVSFPEGEYPSKEVLENIENVLSIAIGYQNHQRLLAVHSDTANLHMHVAINRVHPHTFKCIGTYRDYYILQRTAAELEVAHGLMTENHTPFTRTQPRTSFIPSWQARPPHSIDPDLFAQYTEAKQTAAQARNAALAALRAQHAAYFQKLTQWHKTRRANAQSQQLNKGDRLSTAAYLKAAADQDHAERKLKEKRERDALKQQYPLVGSFEDFRRSVVLAQARTADERIRAHAHLHFSERAQSSRSPAR